MNNKIFTFLTTVLLLVLGSCFGISAFASADVDVSFDEAVFSEDVQSVELDADLVSEDEFQAPTELSFSTDNIAKTLPVMGYGMLGIFIVIIMIGIVVVALNKLFPPKAGE